jgi:hypothetical protein
MLVQFTYGWENRTLIYTHPVNPGQKFILREFIDIDDVEELVYSAVYKQLYYHSGELYKVANFIYSI